MSGFECVWTRDVWTRDVGPGGGKKVEVQWSERQDAISATGTKAGANHESWFGCVKTVQSRMREMKTALQQDFQKALKRMLCTVVEVSLSRKVGWACAGEGGVVSRVGILSASLLLLRPPKCAKLLGVVLTGKYPHLHGSESSLCVIDSTTAATTLLSSSGSFHTWDLRVSTDAFNYFLHE